MAYGSINVPGISKSEMEAAIAEAAIYPQIIVHSTAGTALECSDGKTTLAATATGGKAVFNVPNLGVWTVTEKTAGGASKKITVDAVKIYGVRLSGAHVFGVEWDYGNPSTALKRLTILNDPEGYATEDITEEPTPAVGAGAGSSPFDAYAPWNGMEEYNIVNGAVSYKSGDAGFSRTDHDTVVFIPEFWFAVKDEPYSTPDGDFGKRRYYISDAAIEGFQKHPGSGRYIGRYVAGGTGTPASGDLEFAEAFSKSGLTPWVSITRGDARTVSQAKGAKWQQYDFATYSAIIMLYLVEYADWDSQTAIGSGICGSSDFTEGQAAGLTDGMVYHTGRCAGENEEACQIQYRHIEGLWGNVFNWIDGINFNNKAALVCTNPASFADDTDVGYTDTGVTLPSSGFITGMGLSEAMPWAMIPDASGGSETTFVPDRVNSSAGWRALCVGGNWAYTRGNVGLLYFIGYYTASYAYDYRGFRLLFNS